MYLQANEEKEEGGLTMKMQAFIIRDRETMQDYQLFFMLKQAIELEDIEKIVADVTNNMPTEWQINDIMDAISEKFEIFTDIDYKTIFI